MPFATALLALLLVGSEPSSSKAHGALLSSCIESGRRAEAAGSIAEAYSVLQSCTVHQPARENGEAAALRSYAVLHNELARLATTLLAVTDAITYFETALTTMRELPTLQVEGVEVEISSLELRAVSIKPTLHLIAGDIEGAVHSSRTLAHAKYNGQKLPYMMEDAGPVFVYAQNFLERAVSDASSDEAITVSAEVKFSIHSNVGIKLLQYGADDLGLMHFQKAAEIDPSHAGMQVRVAMAYPAVKNSFADLQIRRRLLEQNTRELISLAQDGGLAMQEPTFEIGYASSFLANYDGMNDRPFMEAQYAAFSALCPHLSRVDEYYADPRRLLDPETLRGVTLPLKRHPRLRVGFLSTNFRSHSVGKLFLGLLQDIDSKLFEIVVARGAGGRNDAVWNLIRRSADHTVELEPQQSVAVAQLLSLDLDLMVFADIGMDPYTYFIAFARVAPVQMTFFGHPTTSGLPTIDYFLTSEFIEPRDAHEAYTEQLVYLPRLATLYFATPAAPQEITRSMALGLQQGSAAGESEGTHAYVCPQSLCKLHPHMDRALFGILRADPKATIFLLNDANKRTWEATLRKRWKAALAEVEQKEGLSAGSLQGLTSRVRFLAKVGFKGWLGLLNHADVLLDTFPFGAYTSTLEGFSCCGTPVVTMPSSQNKMLTASAAYVVLNITGLTAQNVSEYVDLAVKLGTNTSLRKAKRLEIQTKIRPLFHDRETVREWESFLVTAHKIQMQAQEQEQRESNTE